MVFRDVSNVAFFALILISSMILTTKADAVRKKAFFSAAKPDEASVTRIFLKSFSSPSELSCSQKCLRHDQCNFKKYNPETKQCELLRQINNDDLTENAVVTKKGFFCHNKHSKCKTTLCNGCGENCKCENTSGKYRCNCLAKGAYKSCKESLESNGFQTAIYQISPEGFETPVNVECMKDDQGRSFAVVHHGNETATTVPEGYEDPGSYKYTFNYSLDMSVITALINKSVHCQQYTKARCYGVYFYTSGFGWNAWINGRNGQKLDFWGGGPSNGTGCACGVTKTCDVASENCNCDANTYGWRSDEGNVVQKEFLPITAINVGDTGHYTEKFIYTIGPLFCVI